MHQSKRPLGELLSMNPSSFVRRCDTNVLRAPVVNHASRFGLYKVDDAEHGMVEPAFKWSKMEMFSSVILLLRQVSDTSTTSMTSRE